MTVVRLSTPSAANAAPQIRQAPAGSKKPRHGTGSVHPPANARAGRSAVHAADQSIGAHSRKVPASIPATKITPLYREGRRWTIPRPPM